MGDTILVHWPNPERLEQEARERRAGLIVDAAHYTMQAALQMGVSPERALALAADVRDNNNNFVLQG